MTEAHERKRFEKWISSSPYEENIERWPDNDHYGWPGTYRDIKVQLVWEAWQESRRVDTEDNGKAI